MKRSQNLTVASYTTVAVWKLRSSRYPPLGRKRFSRSGGAAGGFVCVVGFVGSVCSVGFPGCSPLAAGVFKLIRQILAHRPQIRKQKRRLFSQMVELP